MPTNAAIIRMTDQQLLEEVWFGTNSEALFSVREVTGTGVAREVTYGRLGQSKVWTKPISTFSERVRPATREELAQALTDAVVEESGGVEVGTLVEPDHRHELDRMVLYTETRQALRIGLNRVLKRDQLEEVWHLSQIEPRVNRCVLNLHGPPGVGKTMSAYSIAKHYGKSVYHVDYSQIISSHTGDTAKAIKAAFDAARRHDAVLLFDEADSLVSRRVDMGAEGAQAWSTSINQNRNVLCQELDKFDGVMLLSTNKFGNYDEAFLRRVACHVSYRLPNRAMRIELFKRHLPECDRVHVDNWAEIGRASKGFSGGDVLNVVLNAINAASLGDNPDTWMLTGDDLMSEISRVQESKEQHGGKVDSRYLPVAESQSGGKVDVEFEGTDVGELSGDETVNNIQEIPRESGVIARERNAREVERRLSLVGRIKSSQAAEVARD